MPDSNATAGDNAGNTNTDTSTDNKNEGQSSASNTSNDNKKDEGNASTGAKTFTQEEVNSLLAKERKDTERKAKMSEDERTKAELEETRRENRLFRAEKAFTLALGKTVKSPDLLFAAANAMFEFDESGKVSNMTEVVKDLKSRYPEQFENKADGSADGGTGNNQNAVRTMNDWMRGK